VAFVFLMLRRPGPPHALALRSKFEVWTNQISHGAATRRTLGPEVQGPVPPVSATALASRSALVVLLSRPLAVTITLWLAPVFGAVLPGAIGVGNGLVDNDPP
jgi:hypothetical protein